MMLREKINCRRILYDKKEKRTHKNVSMDISGAYINTCLYLDQVWQDTSATWLQWGGTYWRNWNWRWLPRRSVFYLMIFKNCFTRRMAQHLPEKFVMIYKVGGHFSCNTGEKTAKRLWWVVQRSGTRGPHGDQRDCWRPLAGSLPGSLRQALAVKAMSQKQLALTMGGQQWAIQFILLFNRGASTWRALAAIQIKKKKKKSTK